MRLIDADAFKEYMRKALEETKDCYPDKGEWAEDITEQFCKDIDDQPTVEPERKKGKWIPVTNGRGRHCCDRCNGYAPSYMNGDEHLSDFCPNCGADMRGDKDD